MQVPGVVAREVWEVGMGTRKLMFNGDRVSVYRSEKFGRWMMVRFT